VITVGDLYTYELTMELRQNLCMLFGGMCPAAVYNNLSRVKFDANRDKSQATFNVPEVVCAFLRYKSSIDDAKRRITRYPQVGLFIDIHGHGHRFDCFKVLCVHIFACIFAYDRLVLKWEGETWSVAFHI